MYNSLNIKNEYKTQDLNNTGNDRAIMKDNSFQAAIKSYLDERAKADELFAKAYNKENKSIDECCSYILGEAKRGQRGCHL